MRVHYIQHVAFENIGSMEKYFKTKKHKISSTRFYLKEPLPNREEYDWLIVMGGPMSANDNAKYPWLKEEKQFIKTAIETNKIVLGICLGAQLIASVLGAKIYRNKYKEIGWFPIWPKEEINTTILKGLLPSEVEVFHWHGETFELPQTAISIAYSKACENQGFIIDNRIVGLQFHLETTPQSAKTLLKNASSDLENSPFVQDEREIFRDKTRFERINTIMHDLLERLESTQK